MIIVQEIVRSCLKNSMFDCDRAFLGRLSQKSRVEAA
jgi:hypothetical protein